MHYGNLLIPKIQADPMLLSVDEDIYSTAKVRIMICGQETRGWTNGNEIMKNMDGYRDFRVNNYHYGGHQKSAFWKAFRYFKSEIDRKYGAEECVYVYQNINKIGLLGVNGMNNQVRNLERSHFPVVSKEFEILKPDIVIFLTGPSRDHDIKFHFPDLRFAKVGDESDLKRMAWLKSENLPQQSLRLYHPCYYRAFTNMYKNTAIDMLLNNPK